MSRREFLKGALAVGAYHSLSSLLACPTGWNVSAAEADAAAGSLVARRAAEPADRHGLRRFSRPRGVGARFGDRPLGRRHASGRLVREPLCRCPTRRSDASRDVAAGDGPKTDAAAWKNLFRFSNQQRGRGDVGYQPGEKVVVKLNLNCCQRRVDPAQGFYNTPQLTQALLRQLVRQAGVREADLVVADASRFVPDSIFDPCHAEFPAVRFEDRDGDEGRFRVMPDLGTAICFADPAAPKLGKTYLPQCLTSATYQINAAVLKGHSLAGVTLCAKNHFGSLYRENTGPSDTHRGWNPASAPVDHRYPPAGRQLQRAGRPDGTPRPRRQNHPLSARRSVRRPPPIEAARAVAVAAVRRRLDGQRAWHRRTRSRSSQSPWISLVRKRARSAWWGPWTITCTKPRWPRGRPPGRVTLPRVTASPCRAWASTNTGTTPNRGNTHAISGRAWESSWSRREAVGEPGEGPDLIAAKIGRMQPGSTGFLWPVRISCLLVMLPIPFSRRGETVAITLIVVDNQEVVRKGLASLLAGEDIEIVAEAASGTAAISKTRNTSPMCC